MNNLAEHDAIVLPDRVQLPFSFEPLLLARDLATVAPMGWTPHFVTQNYDGDWSVIALRCAAGASHPVMMIYSDPTATVFEDTPLLGVCPYFRTVLDAFACPIQSVRLMRLAPGARIKEHCDHDLGIESGTARIHIPITTNLQVAFELNRRRIVMEPGSAWYLRLCDPHRVTNNGTTDRVHLVMDVIANDWMKRLLKDAGRPRKQGQGLPANCRESASLDCW